MRIAFDTNVLGYAEGLDDPGRQGRAKEVFWALHRNERALPLQAAAELHRLLMRRRRFSASEATNRIGRWLRFCPVQPETSGEVFRSALGIAADHGLQVFDAIILAASAEAGCRLLLSEDMQDGFVWRGLTVANPFAAVLHPLLADALST